MTKTITKPAAAVVRGPARPAERALAPDLTRGAMLLFIALANSANVAFAGQPGVDPTPNGVGRVLNFFLTTFVDSRAYPVFAVMFGYGLVQLANRQTTAGGDARRVLLRRNTWLIIFGFGHATLLYFGDFLGAYGIVGVIATLLLLRRSSRFDRIVLWLWAAQLAYVVGLAVLLAVRIGQSEGGNAALTNTANPSLSAATYGQSVLDRLAEWPVHTATVVPFVIIVWLGMWGARRRLLEDVTTHRRLLQRVAAICLAITVAGAVPYALVAAGALHVDRSTMQVMSLLHAVSGEYGGPGYVALFGLLALRFSHTGASGPRAALIRAVSALGRRSLSGYLFQSIAWITLLSPWALGLGRHGNASYVAASVAVAVWVVSVVLAWRMDIRGLQGPAEALLRRGTYGRRAYRHTPTTPVSAPAEN